MGMKIRFDASGVMYGPKENILGFEDLNWVDTPEGFIVGDRCKLVDGAPVIMTQQEKDDFVMEIRLSTFKNAHMNSIDSQTKEYILEGFDFGGDHFSLSIPARSNWTDVLAVISNSDIAVSSLITFPFTVSSSDPVTGGIKEFEFADKNQYEQFYAAGFGKVSWAVHTGRKLKRQVEMAVSTEEIIQIVDTKEVRDALFAS